MVSKVLVGLKYLGAVGFVLTGVLLIVEAVEGAEQYVQTFPISSVSLES